jgi:hypothetical protein
MNSKDSVPCYSGDKANSVRAANAHAGSSLTSGVAASGLFD